MRVFVEDLGNRVLYNVKVGSVLAGRHMLLKVFAQDHMKAIKGADFYGVCLHLFGVELPQMLVDEFVFHFLAAFGERALDEGLLEEREFVFYVFFVDVWGEHLSFAVVDAFEQIRICYWRSVPIGKICREYS